MPDFNYIPFSGYIMAFVSGLVFTSLFVDTPAWMSAGVLAIVVVLAVDSAQETVRTIRWRRALRAGQHRAGELKRQYSIMVNGKVRDFDSREDAERYITEQIMGKEW